MLYNAAVEIEPMLLMQLLLLLLILCTVGQNKQRGT